MLKKMYILRFSNFLIFAGHFGQAFWTGSSPENNPGYATLPHLIQKLLDIDTDRIFIIHFHYFQIYLD